jgi:hypothetical protein
MRVQTGIKARYALCRERSRNVVSSLHCIVAVIAKWVISFMITDKHGYQLPLPVGTMVWHAFVIGMLGMRLLRRSRTHRPHVTGDVELLHPRTQRVWVHVKTFGGAVNAIDSPAAIF